MKIVTYGGDEYYITKAQFEQVEAMIEDKSFIKIGGSLIATRDIRKIAEGGQPPIDRSNLIAESHSLTEAELAERAKRNKDKLDEMKRQLQDKGVFSV